VATSSTYPALKMETCSLKMSGSLWTTQLYILKTALYHLHSLLWSQMVCNVFLTKLWPYIPAYITNFTTVSTLILSFSFMILTETMFT
jgi:hypothetical protein